MKVKEKANFRDNPKSNKFDNFLTTKYDIFSRL